MVGIGKAFSGPSQIENFHFFKCFNNIDTHVIKVQNLALFSSMITVINTAPRMLSKSSITVFVDLKLFFGLLNLYFSLDIKDRLTKEMPAKNSLISFVSCLFVAFDVVKICFNFYGIHLTHNLSK